MKYTEQSLRATVTNLAASFIGRRESDGSHKPIIDIYNADKPLPRGYKMTYRDAWCAGFISTVAIKAGLTDILPKECSCAKMIEIYRKLNRWQENDGHTPKPGDIIFYDWDDSGNGDNTGNPDHVGIVVSVERSIIKVIEGNISNAVGYRIIAINAKNIRGYGLPDYAGKAEKLNADFAALDDARAALTAATAIKAADFKAGDAVNFAGGNVYATSDATKSAANRPASTCQLTHIAKNARHSYHLVSQDGKNVYGWVDAALVSRA
jgi:hypothetical protein